MTTPTNHTSTSLFDFRDLLEPEPSQDSELEQHSSIDNSTMLVSGMGEASNHSRYSSSALGDILEDKENTNSTNNNGGVTFQEPKNPATAALPATKEEEGADETKPETKPSGVLKKSKYNQPQSQPEDSLKVHTEYVIPLEIDSDDDEPQRQQAFSPTVHTSNQTMPFHKMANSPHVMSPTVHRSNQTPGYINAKKQRLKTTTETANDAEQATAWAIHFALIFFCGLILSCVLLTIRVVHTYGFLTVVLMACVLAFCGFLACFVDSTILSQNPKLKPVREAIVTVVNVAKHSIAEEYHLFVRDWKESMLLLTEDGENTTTTTDDGLDAGILPTTQKRRKKSKVFKIMIKPFLGKLRRRKKNKNAGNGSPVTPYEAPEI